MVVNLFFLSFFFFHVFLRSILDPRVGVLIFIRLIAGENFQPEVHFVF